MGSLNLLYPAQYSNPFPNSEYPGSHVMKIHPNPRSVLNSIPSVSQPTYLQVPLSQWLLVREMCAWAMVGILQ